MSERGTRHILCLSGGKDSSALAVHMRDRVQEMEYVFCDTKEELREMLMGAMKTLPERYQKVVVLYYTNDMTMKEIGGLLGINESRVSQIHKTALEKMAIALQSAGIHSSGAF